MIALDTDQGVSVERSLVTIRRCQITTTDTVLWQSITFRAHWGETLTFTAAEAAAFTWAGLA